MKYIEKLLNGAEVKWMTVEEISKNISSGGTPRSNVAAYYGGNIPWLRTQEVNFREIWDTGIKITEEGLNSSSAKYIPANCIIVAMYGATVGRVGINKIPLTTNQACANIEVNDNIAYYRYIYHYLSSQYEYIKSLGAGSQTNINAGIVKKIKVPIPPLYVQEEIVRILDKFTTLETELEAELDCRKRQYEYYRNQLLSFDMLKRGGQKLNSVSWLTLDEVFETRNGYTPSKANAAFWENGTIPWFRMEDIRANGGVLKDSIQHVTPQAIKGKGLFMAGSIIMATTATIGEHALITVDALANQQFTNFRVRNSIEDKLLTKFVYYYFFVIDEWCKQNVNVSSFPSVEIERLKKQPFPIPPLAEQQRIVSILDKFEALTTSISEGLPKEIELRRKQYEYYRNQLLSFA
jgi:type I site-specific deoxyribonuclease